MRRGRVPELGVFLLILQLVRNIGVTNLPPVTFLAILAQVAVYLQFLVVPRLCLSAAAVWSRGEYLRLLVPAIRHTHDIHLYYNMVSLAWKGLALERRLGSVRFLVTLVVLTLMSSVAYVLLAVFISEITEDYSYMDQCAIGFSGVLFALKVLTTHYSGTGEERESFFGFLVPLRYAVWLELLIIQVMVPNTSFIGHLGGILAGLVFLKGPFGGIPSVVRSTSVLPVGPGCLLLCGLAVAGHLGVFFGTPTLGCLPTRHLYSTSWLGISFSEGKYIALAPLYHLGHIHLGINLLSLVFKGRRLEKELGFLRFLFTAALSVLGTVFSFWILNRILYEATGGMDHLVHCVVGLSGPLFALKVLAILYSKRTDLTLVYELIELIVLLEKNHRLYHLSGLFTGAVLYLCAPTKHSWTSGGRRLGGDSSFNGAEPWTRSWGYGGEPGVRRRQEDTSDQYTNELNEALHQSRQQYLQEHGVQPDAPVDPSAPLYEADLEGRPPLYPDLEVRPPLYPDLEARPPLYPDNPGPPPAGGWRLPPRDPAMEEMRRRRLERFS